MKSITVLFSALLVCCSAGCQQRMSNKLLGRWEGRPDSAERRAQREAEKYGDDPAQIELRARKSETVQVTDWEDYDVEIVMDFVSSDLIKMTLDGAQSQAGNWRIVSQSPAGCTIEIQTRRDGENDRVVRRRFDLLLDERDGSCVGFQLTETGADPQVGALYFRRPKS